MKSGSEAKASSYWILFVYSVTQHCTKSTDHGSLTELVRNVFQYDTRNTFPPGSTPGGTDLCKWVNGGAWHYNVLGADDGTAWCDDVYTHPELAHKRLTALQFNRTGWDKFFTMADDLADIMTGGNQTELDQMFVAAFSSFGYTHTPFSSDIEYIKLFTTLPPGYVEDVKNLYTAGVAAMNTNNSIRLFHQVQTAYEFKIAF